MRRSATRRRRPCVDGSRRWLGRADPGGWPAAVRSAAIPHVPVGRGPVAAQPASLSPRPVRRLRDEQRRRLQERYDDPKKRWKFKLADLEERKLWDDYQLAFDDALSKTSTAWAPWYVIPANRKWYRNLAVATILADSINRLKPAYPPEPDLPKDLVIT